MKLLQHLFIALVSLSFSFLILTPLMVGTVSFGSADGDILPVAQAQEETYSFLAPIGGFGDDVDVTSTSSFANYIQTGITLMIGFAVMAAIVLIIAAGFQYMTSTSQGATTQAKQTMSNAIFGLILALMAVLILQTINPNLVKLSAVDTVTTSGSSFDFEIKEKYKGAIHDKDANTHGNKYCILLDAAWYSFSSDKYVCYNSEVDCQEGLENAHNDGWDEASCDFYYQSQGAIVDSETGEEIDGTQAVGVSPAGMNEARSKCVSAIGREMELYGSDSEANIEAFFNENPQCETEETEYTISNVLYGERCSAQCEEPDEI